MQPVNTGMLSNYLESLNKVSSQYALNVVIFIIVSAFFIYVFIIIRKDKNNCATLNDNKMNTNIVSLLTKSNMDLTRTALNQTLIKTAYNCCCSGEYKNDYVNYCALINCAKQGVRALDFTIYSLKDTPVVAASTLQSNDYKETYNSLPFSDTMAQVYQYFVSSNMNCPNISDPLFLIFRVKSLLKTTYDQMASILNSTFGDNSLNGNLIFYIKQIDKTLDNVLLTDLTNNKVQGCKVIILIDISGLNKDLYRKSKLSLMCALNIGNGDNVIYRESDLIQQSDIDEFASNSLSFLYPDFSKSSNNYNFVNGLNRKINFIGMSFQTNDVHLKVYNEIFLKNSIISVNDEKVKALLGPLT